MYDKYILTVKLFLRSSFWQYQELNKNFHRQETLKLKLKSLFTI